MNTIIYFFVSWSSYPFLSLILCLTQQQQWQKHLLTQILSPFLLYWSHLLLFLCRQTFTTKRVEISRILSMLMGFEVLGKSFVKSRVRQYKYKRRTWSWRRTTSEYFDSRNTTTVTLHCICRQERRVTQGFHVQREEMLHFFAQNDRNEIHSKSICHKCCFSCFIQFNSMFKQKEKETEKYYTLRLKNRKKNKKTRWRSKMRKSCYITYMKRDT